MYARSCFALSAASLSAYNRVTPRSASSSIRWLVAPGPPISALVTVPGLTLAPTISNQGVLGGRSSKLEKPQFSRRLPPGIRPRRGRLCEMCEMNLLQRNFMFIYMTRCTLTLQAPAPAPASSYTGSFKSFAISSDVVATDASTPLHFRENDGNSRR